MRQTILFTCILLSSIGAIAQNKQSTAPFTLHGQLTNFSKDQMILFFLDPALGYRDYTIDTIKVEKDGSFYLKTYKPKTPTIATLRKDDLSVDLYIAPGYDLAVTGDVTDVNKFHFNKKLPGKVPPPINTCLRLILLW